MNLLQTIKKYPKDTMKVIAVVILGILAVSSDGFSDLAKTKFWWSFWGVVQVLAIVTWVVGWFYLKNKQREADKEK